ncbi:MAG: hypothetical protein JO125_06215 [Chloroflexi bacterium]|nr:hypothetical protein [Ktedonobacteraceae bacterium]MBV9019181.1 hypothetical protein [Ktedonobacteraceae bacterium]MBV9706982.1 hypothetical protein [Chloroflexota bacterium]
MKEEQYTILSTSTLIEQCQREIQAYRRAEPSHGVYSLELLYRAIVQSDQEAQRGIEQCLGEMMRRWFYEHPYREAASHRQNEETYIPLAFKRFWHLTMQQQMTFQTLASALVYLYASLNGVILEILRTYSQPQEVWLLGPSEAHNETWQMLETMLSSSREQRLAYLLYHCGLKPKEIVHLYPQEWGDVQEVYRLRCIILERLAALDGLK